MAGIPVADDLFTWPDESPQLIGSRCEECGTTTFPRQDSCPRCTATRMQRHLLERRGTLWTFTTQEFLPKNPPYGGTETADEFVPYGVGYVRLGDDVIVQSRLTEAAPDRLRIGMEMELRVLPLRRDDEGNDVLTFAFAPVAPDPGSGDR